MDFRLKKILMNFIYGSIFGFASPVPGISAGTMAILLNVYDKFFNSFNRAFLLKNTPSVISFLLGWAIGLFGISSIMMFLFDNHGQIISFAFIGLILGCLPLIYKKATEGKLEIRNFIVFLIAFGAMAFLAFFGGDLATNSSIEQLGTTPLTLTWLFIASFVSSMAMLIPGVGGSLMMIAFGIYTIYLESVSTFNIPILIIFGVSMVFGVLAGIVITRKLLKSFAKLLYSAICGFIVGSLLIIFPGISMDIEGIISVIVMCFCFGVAYWLSKKE